MKRLYLSIAVFAFATGCMRRASSSGNARVNENTRPGVGTPLGTFAACEIYTAEEPSVSRDHVTSCSEIAFGNFPVAGGQHYSSWADFGRYDAPVPLGFLVHSLEHGAVVLAYKCPDGCPDVVAGLQAIADAQVDDVCRAAGRDNRMIVVPEPRLRTPIAVLAWEHIFEATCFDDAAIREFVAAHYAHAPEDLCAAGFRPTSGPFCP